MNDNTFTLPQGAQGDNGWSPVFALVADGSRIVQQLTAWKGGEGIAPIQYVGMYVGSTGFVVDIADGVNISPAPAITHGFLSSVTDYAVQGSDNPVPFTSPSSLTAYTSLVQGTAKILFNGYASVASGVASIQYSIRKNGTTIADSTRVKTFVTGTTASEIVTQTTVAVSDGDVIDVVIKQTSGTWTVKNRNMIIEIFR